MPGLLALQEGEVMDHNDLVQPTLIVTESDGHRRLSISWPDPEHKPRYVKLLPELLEEIVDQLNDLRTKLCPVCSEERSPDSPSVREH